MTAKPALYGPANDSWAPHAEFRVTDAFHDAVNEEGLDAQGRRVVGLFGGRGYVFDAPSVLVQ